MVCTSYVCTIVCAWLDLALWWFLHRIYANKSENIKEIKMCDNFFIYLLSWYFCFILSKHTQHTLCACACVRVGFFVIGVDFCALNAIFSALSLLARYHTHHGCNAKRIHACDEHSNWCRHFSLLSIRRFKVIYIALVFLSLSLVLIFSSYLGGCHYNLLSGIFLFYSFTSRRTKVYNYFVIRCWQICWSDSAAAVSILALF